MKIQFLNQFGGLSQIESKYLEGLPDTPKAAKAEASRRKFLDSLNKLVAAEADVLARAAGTDDHGGLQAELVKVVVGRDLAKARLEVLDASMYTAWCEELARIHEDTERRKEAATTAWRAAKAEAAEAIVRQFGPRGAQTMTRDNIIPRSVQELDTERWELTWACRALEELRFMVCEKFWTAWRATHTAVVEKPDFRKNLANVLDQLRAARGA